MTEHSGGRDRPGRPEQPDQPERLGQPEQFGQSDRPDQADRLASPEQADRLAQPNRPARPNRLAQPNRPARPEQAGHTEQPVDTEQPVQPEPTEQPDQPSRRAEILAGIRISLAAGLGLFPLGVAFGLLVIQMGLPWWVAPALSICVFAGSLELLLLTMMTAGAPLATVALTTFLVNFRHVFYAFSFPLRVVKNPVARAYSVYALIDEAYAVTVANPERWTAWRLLTMQIAFQAYWVGGGLAGVLVASLLPGPIEGLDFALCALFVTLTLDACRTCRQVPSLLLAGAAFALARVIAPDTALFTGLLVFVAALVIRYAVAQVRGRGPGRARWQVRGHGQGQERWRVRGRGPVREHRPAQAPGEALGQAQAPGHTQEPGHTRALGQAQTPRQAQAPGHTQEPGHTRARGPGDSQTRGRSDDA